MKVMSDCRKVAEKDGSLERLSKEVYRLQEAVILADITFGLVNHEVLPNKVVSHRKVQKSIYRALVRVLMLVYGFCEKFCIDIDEINIDVMRRAYKETVDE